MKRLLAFIVILALGFCAYWYALRIGVERALETAQADLAEDGITVSLPTVTYTGFPMSVRAAITEPQITGPAGSIRAEVFTLSASTFKPTHWVLQSQGDMRIDWRKDAQTRYLFDVSPSLVRAKFNASLSGQIKSVRATGFKLTAEPVLGTAPPLRAIESIVIDIQPAGGNMAFDLSVVDAFMDRSTARDIQRVFGPHVKALSVKGTLEGLMSLDEEAVESWRESGQFKIIDSDMVWGDGQFKGAADLALSQSGASGTMTVKMRDAQKLLDGLIAAGKIDSQTALGARFALIAAPRDETGLLTLTLPIERNEVKVFGQTVFKF